MLVLSRPICPFLVLLTRKICTVYVIADIAGTQKKNKRFFHGHIAKQLYMLCMLVRIGPKYAVHLVNYLAN